MGVKEKVLIAGAGGHASVVADVLTALGLEVAAFNEAKPTKDGFLGVPVVGEKELPGLLASGVRKAIVAIGDNKIRTRVASSLVNLGFELVSIIAPSAVVSRGAKIGRGTVVMPGAVVNTGTTVGENAIVNTGATVDHDCRIGNGVHLAPGARLAGNVTVSDLAFVGVGACLIPGTRVGEGATVGAGAVVLSDVEEHSTAVGNPAKTLRRDNP